jgi:hypothetical protein
MNKVFNVLAMFLFFAGIYELNKDDLFLTMVALCSLMLLLVLAVGLEIKDDRRVRVFQKSMGRGNNHSQK